MPNSDAAKLSSAAIRAFIAVNLPPELKARMAQLQRELQKMTGGRAVRWTRSEQIHLTLRFLGDVPANAVADLHAALQRACTGIAPFELSAEGLGCFPNARQPRIIWLGLTGALDALQRLQARVEQETAAWGQREDREFHAHLTLGRVKPEFARTARPLAESFASRPKRSVGTWRVAQVDLMQSQLLPTGAEYAVMTSVPLAETACGNG